MQEKKKCLDDVRVSKWWLCFHLGEISL